MSYNYSNQDYNKEHMARAVGVALQISTKATIEICNAIRNKKVSRAKTILKNTISMKNPIKYTRFTEGAGHKPGMASGKYPVNASKEILELIEQVEANAQFKGLNTSDLIITHISAQKGGNSWRAGRHRRRKHKRTHLEIIVKETKQENKVDKKEKPGIKVNESKNKEHDKK
jgi:large subunit ribosomal protein L22